MAGERRFVISISGEDRGASATLRKTGAAAEQFGRQAKGTAASSGVLISQLSGAMPGAAGRATSALGGLTAGLGMGAGSATLFAGAIAASAVAAGRFAMDAVKSASAVQEQTEATKQTFGESAAAVIAWSKTTADSVGISQAAALQAANAFGGMFTNLGFTAEKSLDMSQAAVQLAGDLASFKNLGVDEALAKIRSGLAGEVEPLRNVGVFLGEATVKSRAMADGLADSKGELSETAKVATRFQLILEQTGKSQGDAARTAESYANTQRRLAAASEDLKAKLGEMILPHAADTMIGLERGLQGIEKALDEVSDKVPGGDGLLGDILKGAINPMGLLGEKSRETASTTDRLAEATKIYSKVVIEGKQGTEQGRAAKEAYANAVRAAELETGRLGSALETETEKQEKATKAAAEREQALDTATDSVFALASAQRSMTQATDAVADADEAVAEAQADLNRLRQQGAVDAKAVQRAEESLAAASRNVTDAREAEADAERDLAKAREKASAFDLEGAQLDIENAALGWIRAGDRLREAEKALAEGRAEGVVGLELNDLELDVAEARLANTQASRSITEAEAALTTMRQQGTAEDERVKEAEDRVVDARRRVEDATRARGVAEAELRVAQAGDPAWGEVLREAADKVADAQHRAKDARWRAADAAVGLQGAMDKEREALGATAGSAAEVGRRIDNLIRQHPQLAAVLGTVRALLGTQGNPNYSYSLEREHMARAPTSRAAGGDMDPGVPYLINEGAQTEVYTSGPARMTPVAGLGGATVNASIVLNANGVSDADELIRRFGPKIVDFLRREVRRSGGLGFENPLGR